MLFYIILIITVVLLTGVFFKKEDNKKGYFLASLILTFVAAFRFDVGWDYQTYYEAIDELFLPTLLRFEPLSLVIALPAILTGNPFLFFILSSFIIYPLAFWSFKKISPYPSLSLIIYLGLFYLISCSIVRQAIAVSICLFAFRYVLSRSFFKYVLCISLAILFHYSAAVTLVIYPVYHWFKFKHIFIGLILCLLLRNILLGLLESYGLYADYLSRLNDMEGGALTRYFYLLIFLSFFFIIKFGGYTIEERKMFSIIAIGLFAPYLLGAAMGERIGYYFIIYYCYLIPKLLQGKKVYKRGLYAMVFSMYFLVMVYFTASIPGQKSAYTPYRTIFNISRIDFKN